MQDGIMKNGNRTEPNWKKITFKEPFKEATDKFREKVLKRTDFDPATLLQFGLFMSKSLLQVMEDVEENFGPEGQKVCNKALEKVGRNLGKQMFGGLEVPKEGSPIELMSFVATWINTVAWTSIEDPHIINEDKCEFDILWCPLEDVYGAFDCRVQRYLVQGIIDYVRDEYGKDLDRDYDIEFLSTIPAGAKTCKFQIVKRNRDAPDKWRQYSNFLEQRALKRWKKKQKKNSITQENK